MSNTSVSMEIYHNNCGVDYHDKLGGGGAITSNIIITDSLLQTLSTLLHF